MPRFYNRVVYETDRLLSPGRLDEFIDRLDASSSVQFCACGLNAYIAQESCFKLQAVGLNAQSCDAVNVQAIKHRGDPAATVGVVISHTGANAATIRAESLFRENGIWCAAFTPGDASPVARAADLSLRLFCTSSADRLSLLSYPISVRYMVYKMAAPTGIVVDIISVSSSKVKWEADSFYGNEPVLLLFKTIDAAVASISEGIRVNELQVGGLENKPGRKIVHNQISLDKADAEKLGTIEDKGIRVYFQTIPGEVPEELDKVVKKLG